MQSIYLQRVMKTYRHCGFVKTKPIKANNQSSLINNHLEGKANSNPIKANFSQLQGLAKPKQTQKMNAFTWIRSVIMIYYDILMVFDTFRGGLFAVNHIRALIRARINTGQKWSISKTNH